MVTLNLDLEYLFFCFTKFCGFLSISKEILENYSRKLLKKQMFPSENRFHLFKVNKLIGKINNWKINDLLFLPCSTVFWRFFRAAMANPNWLEGHIFKKIVFLRAKIWTFLNIWSILLQNGDFSETVGGPH